MGGSSDGFHNTTLNDQASTSIRNGSFPFTGSYRPEGSLASFNGQSANGQWTLEITDDAGRDIGILDYWQLSLRDDHRHEYAPRISLSQDSIPGETILDVDLTLDITHNEDERLSVHMVSPSGTRIRLFDDVGGTGDDFTNTTFR